LRLALSLAVYPSVIGETKKTIQDEENDSRDKSFGTISDRGKFSNCDKMIGEK
jgi:hypothetical protein